MNYILIRLEISGDPEHAMEAVNAALDNGTLQEEINSYPEADLLVQSTVAMTLRLEIK
jgi:hypothetical protein